VENEMCIYGIVLEIGRNNLKYLDIIGNGM